MIRILQIMDNIAVSSGVSSIVLNIYRNINRQQVQFDFLVSNHTKKSYESEIIQYGGKVTYIGNPLSMQSLVIACRNSKRFFERHSSDYIAVHLHSPTIAEMTIRYAKKNGIKNIIVHSHSTMFSDNPIKRILNSILVARLGFFTTHHWFCSEEAGKFLFGKRFYAKSNSQWIRNAIDIEDKQFNKEIRNKVRNKYNIEDCKVACHISNFSPIKNLKFLLEVIRQVVKQDETWRFLFVGDGPWKLKLEEKLYKIGLSKYCIFVGFSAQVNDFLNAADIFLLPSIKEGLPVVSIEAQVCGLPCLLSHTITEQANIGGLTYLPLDRALWIEKLNSFEAKSESERQDISVKLVDSVFNIKTEARRVERLYLEMLIV